MLYISSFKLYFVLVSNLKLTVISNALFLFDKKDAISSYDVVFALQTVYNFKS
jgi:hypothetical protein